MTTDEKRCEIRGMTPAGLGIGVTESGDRVHVVGGIAGEVLTVRMAGVADGTPYGVPTGFERSHPARVEPFCPAFERCMKCPWMAYPLEMQEALIRRLVERFLTRLQSSLGIELPELSWTSPELPQRWSGRVRYRYRVHGPGDAEVGFYRPDRVTIESIDDCAVAAHPLGDILPTLRSALREFSLPGTGQIVVSLDDNPDATEAVVCIRADDGHFPDPDWCNTLARSGWPVRGMILQDREYRERFRWGDPTYLPLGEARTDRPVRATAGLPFEDGPEVTRAVRDTVIGWLEESERKTRVLELFAGVGVFTSALYERCDFVDAVTTSAWAIDDLHANFDTVSKERVRRSYASMARGLARPYRKPGGYDLICAWAPRRGAIGLWPTLKEIEAPVLITSHADLLSNGPDLKRIVAAGYQPTRGKLIYAEPHRGRAELVLWWERR